MKGLARILTFLSTGFSIMARVCLRGTPALPLTMFKLPAGATTPFWALVGAVGAALYDVERSLALLV